MGKKLKSDLRQDFTDSKVWVELAKKYLPEGTRLPRWGTPCTPDGLRYWIKRLRVKKHWNNALGITDSTEFIELNPKWPLRAAVGLMLELKEEIK